MKAYKSEGTGKTPAINFDPLAKSLLIKGRSIPEDPIAFYGPLMEALSNCSAASLPRFDVTINLEYFNTSSSRCIYNIFKKLELISKEGSSIVINWAYEEGDDEMLEVGEDFRAILDVPFKMLPLRK